MALFQIWRACHACFLLLQTDRLYVALGIRARGDTMFKRGQPTNKVIMHSCGFPENLNLACCSLCSLDHQLNGQVWLGSNRTYVAPYKMHWLAGPQTTVCVLCARVYAIFTLFMMLSRLFFYKVTLQNRLFGHHHLESCLVCFFHRISSLCISTVEVNNTTLSDPLM